MVVSPKMVVAQVVGKMVGGGLESVVMNYYRHIDRGKVQFHFIVDADSTSVPRDEIVALGGEVIEVPPYQDVRHYGPAMRELFASRGYGIVHSHINALSVFPLREAVHAGVPVRIAHSHSTSGKGETKKNALKYLLRTQANRYPTHRMACGTYAGTWLFGRARDFTVLPNAIELDRFAFDQDRRVRVRAELGVSPQTLLVGHLGRFTEQKNHGYLVDAFALLKADHPDCTLALAGDGRLRNAVRLRAIEQGVSDSVMLLGQRDDAHDLYSAFDVLCLPSLYEGFPVAAIEAQAAGLPCLLSSRITQEVCLTDLVRYLPIEGSVATWAEAIAGLDVLGEKRADVPRDPRLEPYDIKKAAPVLLEYYERAWREAGL